MQYLSTLLSVLKRLKLSLFNLIKKKNYVVIIYYTATGHVAYAGTKQWGKSAQTGFESHGLTINKLSS